MTTHKEFEVLHEQPIATYILDEYIRNDLERANAPANQFPIVYDSLEFSPFYSQDDSSDLYIDERDAIDVPPPTDTTEGVVNEPYQKKYLYNPNNLPYPLEKA